MAHEAPANSPDGVVLAPRPSKIRWLIRKAWWLHSFGALSFGVGVMLFARKGMAYADKLLMVLGLSWLLMFVALRFIVGPSNRRAKENVAKKSVRVLTNYVIKNLYQQMFFFLVPLYASSATWSLSSWNWWLVPVLLVFAVLSTMDLVFDNFIMERRVLASCMYGFALFGVLNLMLPVVLGIQHFPTLLIAAGATAPAVALLSFPARTVATVRGLSITSAVMAAMIAAAWLGRAAIPPTPLAMSAGAVGHGTLSSYECLPGLKTRMEVSQLDGLRCGALITAPGGIHDQVIHVWRHEGQTVARTEPVQLDGCDGAVFRSWLPQEVIPDDPSGQWQCVVQTGDGQLIGIMKFDVVAPPPAGGTDEARGGADAGPGDGLGDGPEDGGAARDGGTQTRDAPPSRDAGPSSGARDAAPGSDALGAPSPGASASGDGGPPGADTSATDGE